MNTLQPLTLDQQMASRRLRHAITVAVSLGVLIVVATAPFSDIPLPPAPQAVTIYSTATAVVDGATALLLLGAAAARGSRALLALGCAYLFSCCMAVPYMAAFPGAVLAGQTLLGQASTASALFLIWKTATPLLALASIVLQDGRREAMPSPRLSALAYAALTVTACLVLTALAATFDFKTPELRLQTGGPGAATEWVELLPLAICVIGAVLALLGRRARTTLKFWLALVLLGFAGELFLCIVGRTSFSLGWYVGRLFGVVASGLLFCLFLSRILAQSRQLAFALRDAEGRAFALQAEVRLREQAEYRLLQSQKMEALGQLTGGIANDFSTVLQVVGGQVQMLGQRITDPSQIWHLAAIEHALGRAATLTQQLVAFSRRQPMQPRRIDLSVEVPRLVELLRPALRGEITVHWEVAPDILPLEADPAELGLALLNAALSARDAMPKGGRLAILAGNLRLAADAVPGLDGGTYVVITVSDTGPGLQPDVVKRAFEPFFTSHTANLGAGTRLSQVYSFARQCGGIATIESEPERGTTLTLHLPSAPANEAQEPAATEEGVVGRRVLLVEDNDPVADVVGSMLTDFGCVISRVSTAQEAIDVLESGQIWPDIVLSDIVMPGGMSGVDLARRVRQRWPTLPLVLTTGYSNSAQEVLSEGFEVLLKPYRSQGLQRAIEKALARAHDKIGTARLAS